LIADWIAAVQSLPYVYALAETVVLAAVASVMDVALATDRIVVDKSAPDAPAPTTTMIFPTTADVNDAEVEVRTAEAEVIAPSRSCLPSPLAP